MPSKHETLQAETTARIIAMLEGNLEGKWTRPWVGGDVASPVSLSTGNRYKGVNVLLLWMDAMDKGFVVPIWGTFQAWKAKGLFVNKGERGTRIAIPMSFDQKDSNGDVVCDTAGNTKKRFVFGVKTVFNAEQTTGAEEYREKFSQNSPNLATKSAEIDSFFDHCGVETRVASSAFYRPSEDWIGMPEADKFLDNDDATATEHYYGTLAHEFIHSTGHGSRCDRRLASKFEREPYAAEELIAEMGAAMLCGILGVNATVREDHAKYIKSWLTVLRGDNSAIFTAASMANKAITWMMDCQPKDSPFRDKPTNEEDKG